MNRLNLSQRAQILGMLIEGNSVASTCRITGAAEMTVVKLLADVGEACETFQHKALRNLKSTRVQCDETWSFVGSKEKNVPKEIKGALGMGDVWTWTAICAHTKLMLSWMVGRRNARAAQLFMADVADRLTHTAFS